MTIAVFGIGKLGAPLVAVLASSGYDVVGIDSNPDYVRRLNNGEAPVEETGLAAMIAANRQRITAVPAAECSEVILRSDVVFIVVPTPSKEDGTFSCEHVCEVAKRIGPVIGASWENSYKLIVLVSTVMPTQTRTEFIDVLEETSKRECGRDFGVCYNPEFIALGSVIENMEAPDFVLIGQSDEKAGYILEAIYGQVCPAAPIIRMNLVSAEVAKLALNCYVTTKISYANALSELCDKLVGADAYAVAHALGLDSRIGPRCLKPATAYGGPCFPRDNLAMIALTYNLGLVPSLQEATHTVNRRQTQRMADTVAASIPRLNAVVGILGTAYKANTAITEESAGVHLADELKRRGLRVITSDPSARLDTDAPSAQKCVTGSDLVIVMLPCDEFAALDYTGKVVIDCWGILEKERSECKE